MHTQNLEFCNFQEEQSIIVSETGHGFQLSLFLLLIKLSLIIIILVVLLNQENVLYNSITRIWDLQFSN